MMQVNYYDTMMAQVRELRRIASDMGAIQSRKLGAVNENIRGSLRGTTGQVVLAKCNEFGARVGEEAASINRLADALEQAAREAREAENMSLTP